MTFSQEMQHQEEVNRFEEELARVREERKEQKKQEILKKLTENRRKEQLAKGKITWSLCAACWSLREVILNVVQSAVTNLSSLVITDMNGALMTE